MTQPTTGVVRPRPDWAVLRCDDDLADETMQRTGRARWRGSGGLQGECQAGPAGFEGRQRLKPAASCGGTPRREEIRF
jgi:hypothetical protein